MNREPLIEWTDVAARVTQARERAGFSQEQLAERAGVNVKTVQGVEQGRTEPELRTLMAFAKVLGTELETFVPRGTAGSTDAIIRRMKAELQELPVPTLEHLAALVHELATKKK